MTKLMGVSEGPCQTKQVERPELIPATAVARLPYLAGPDERAAGAADHGHMSKSPLRQLDKGTQVLQPRRQYRVNAKIGRSLYAGKNKSTACPGHDMVGTRRDQIHGASQGPVIVLDWPDRWLAA